MDKVFVDTDVILDFLLDRMPHSNFATELFSRGDQGQVKLFTSSLVFSNSYYVLRKIASHQAIIQKFKVLATFIEVIHVGQAEVIDAIHSGFKDFEDALQHAAAVNSGMKLFLTRNTKDYKKAEMAVMTPEDYLKTNF